MIACVLVTIGALNWGLLGLGQLLGSGDWNVVHMILGSMPVVENIVYVLVGVAGVMKIVGAKLCPCKNQCSTN